MSMVNNVLDNCENIFGKLKPDIRKRVRNYTNNPTPDNWDDIKGIIISDKFESIWQSIMAMDSTFPRTGSVTDEKENIIKEWERIPTTFEVLRAIQMFTEKDENSAAPFRKI